AQLCFLDSLDLVGRLPGDVLLIFKFYSDRWTTWDSEMYEFRWVSLGAVDDLWSARDVPPRGIDNDAELYGCLVREFEFPGLASSDECHVFAATKIGGVPTDRQSIRPPEVPSGWRFLAQVAATYPVVGVDLPVVGWEAPVG